jgi:hypothetical protein
MKFCDREARCDMIARTMLLETQDAVDVVDTCIPTPCYILIPPHPGYPIVHDKPSYLVARGNRSPFLLRPSDSVDIDSAANTTGTSTVRHGSHQIRQEMSLNPTIFCKASTGATVTLGSM